MLVTAFVSIGTRWPPSHSMSTLDAWSQYLWSNPRCSWMPGSLKPWTWIVGAVKIWSLDPVTTGGYSCKVESIEASTSPCGMSVSGSSQTKGPRPASNTANSNCGVSFETQSKVLVLFCCANKRLAATLAPWLNPSSPIQSPENCQPPGGSQVTGIQNSIPVAPHRSSTHIVAVNAASTASITSFGWRVGSSLNIGSHDPNGPWFLYTEVTSAPGLAQKKGASAKTNRKWERSWLLRTRHCCRNMWALVPPPWRQSMRGRCKVESESELDVVLENIMHFRLRFRYLLTSQVVWWFWHLSKAWS